jgi:hypothetical protein
MSADDILGPLAVWATHIGWQWRGMNDRFTWSRIINWNWRPRLSLPTRAAP